MNVDFNLNNINSTNTNNNENFKKSLTSKELDSNNCKVTEYKNSSENTNKKFISATNNIKINQNNKCSLSPRENKIKTKYSDNILQTTTMLDSNNDNTKYLDNNTVNDLPKNLLINIQDRYNNFNENNNKKTKEDANTKNFIYNEFSNIEDNQHKDFSSNQFKNNFYEESNYCDNNKINTSKSFLETVPNHNIPKDTNNLTKLSTGIRRNIKWTKEEDDLLTNLVKQFNGRSWKKISSYIPGRTAIQCLHRWTKILKPGLVKGPWTLEEDKMLIDYVTMHGAFDFSECSKLINGRNNKQCRERWFNVLNPKVVKGEWTLEEDYLIFRLYTTFGGRWIRFVPFFNGLRAENSIKNRFYSTIRRYNTVLRKQGKLNISEDDKIESIFKDFYNNLVKKHNITNEEQLLKFEKISLGFDGILENTKDIKNDSCPISKKKTSKINSKEFIDNNSNNNICDSSIYNDIDDFNYSYLSKNNNNNDSVINKNNTFDMFNNGLNINNDNTCYYNNNCLSNKIVDKSLDNISNKSNLKNFTSMTPQIRSKNIFNTIPNNNLINTNLIDNYNQDNKYNNNNCYIKNLNENLIISKLQANASKNNNYDHNKEILDPVLSRKNEVTNTFRCSNNKTNFSNTSNTTFFTNTESNNNYSSNKKLPIYSGNANNNSKGIYNGATKDEINTIKQTNGYNNTISKTPHANLKKNTNNGYILENPSLNININSLPNNINNNIGDQNYRNSSFITKKQLTPTLVPLSMPKIDDITKTYKSAQMFSINELESGIIKICDKPTFTFKDESTKLIENKIKKISDNSNQDPFNFNNSNVNEDNIDSNTNFNNLKCINNINDNNNNNNNSNNYKQSNNIDKSIISNSFYYDNISTNNSNNNNYLNSLLKQLDDLEKLVNNTKIQIHNNFNVKSNNNINNNTIGDNFKLDNTNPNYIIESNMRKQNNYKDNNCFINNCKNTSNWNLKSNNNNLKTTNNACNLFSSITNGGNSYNNSNMFGVSNKGLNNDFMNIINYDIENYDSSLMPLNSNFISSNVFDSNLMFSNFDNKTNDYHFN